MYTRVSPSIGANVVSILPVSEHISDRQLLQHDIFLRNISQNLHKGVVLVLNRLIRSKCVLADWSHWTQLSEQY